MQIECLAPQFVTQIESELRLRLLLQAAMQVFSSRLHCIGSARADAAHRAAKPAAIKGKNVVPRGKLCARESKCCAMEKSYEHNIQTATLRKTKAWCPNGLLPCAAIGT